MSDMSEQVRRRIEERVYLEDAIKSAKKMVQALGKAKKTSLSMRAAGLLQILESEMTRTG